MDVVRQAISSGAFHRSPVSSSLPSLLSVVLGAGEGFPSSSSPPSSSQRRRAGVLSALSSWESDVLPKFREALADTKRDAHGVPTSIEGGRGVLGEGWNVEVVVVHDRGVFRL